jgi:hypothetical protein
MSFSRAEFSLWLRRRFQLSVEPVVLVPGRARRRHGPWLPLLSIVPIHVSKKIDLFGRGNILDDHISATYPRNQ